MRKIKFPYFQLLICFLVALVGSMPNAKAQKSDSARSRTRYQFDRHDSFYYVVQQLMKVSDPGYYLTYINTRQRSTPNPNFRTPEELPKSLLEMRLAQRFILYRGLESKSFDFMMLTKFTANFDFTYRIGKKEDQGSKDNPGLPLNTKFGFTLFEHAFLLDKWCEYRKKERYSEHGSFSTNVLGNTFFDNKNLRILIPRLDFMHYSNGQDTGAVVYVSSTQYRNDYISGNFSTNYTHLQLSYIELSRNNRLLNLTVGLRKDFKLGDWLSFEEKQKDRYGTVRLNTVLQVRTGPFNLFGIRISDREFFEHKGKRKIVIKQINLMEQKQMPADSLKENLVTLEESPKGKRMVKGLFDIVFNFRSEYILDSTPLLKGDKSSIEGSLELIPLYWETIGLTLSYYRGRDYLNIRYDLPVSLIKFGVTFQLGHYRPSDEAIALRYN